MNHFIKEALLKAAVLEAVKPCWTIGITGQELTETCIKALMPCTISETVILSQDIKRVAQLLASRGLIIEEVREEEFDGTIYCFYIYWPITKS